jgi:hypothetical protein
VLSGPTKAAGSVSEAGEALILMICRNCGTEIADKALICYRCGNATSTPERATVPVRRSRARTLSSLVGLVILVFAALFLGQAGQLQVDPMVSYSIAALAAIVLVWRFWRRRRR